MWKSPFTPATATIPVWNPIANPQLAGRDLIRGVLPRLSVRFVDEHLAVHHFPVAGERAEIGIAAGLLGSAK